MGTTRRIRRTVQKQGSLKSAKKQTFLKSVEGWGFPRRTFLKGVGVAALAGLGILAVDYYKDNYALKTWHPGNETWKPVIHTPSEEMDPVDKAIWLVNENICRYSINDLKRMNLQPVDVYYMVTYQLRVKPITPEYLRFYLNALDIEKLPYTNRKKIFFPLALQGHICQFLDTLFRCGIKSTRSFKFKGQTTTLWDILMDEIEGFPPKRMGITNSDPSWIMSAYAGANPAPDRWVSYHSDTDILRYILYALEKNPETGRARCFDFACQGLHFPDALSRLYWYYGQYLKEHEEAQNLQEIILKYIKSIDSMNEPLKRYSSALIPSIEKFREDPTQANFREVWMPVEYLVHALELILEPKGYYCYNFPLTELEPVVKNLSEGIALWYAPEMDSQRELLDNWEAYDNSEYFEKLKSMNHAQRKEMEKINRQMERYTSMSYEGKYSVFFQARLLQGCHGLMLWKEYKQQWAEKHPNSN